jgi:predicted membrane channel-forming protein YqfA (hemolysin III family)
MDELAEARREAGVEATLFILVTAGLLLVLAVTSYMAGWELLGVRGWVWLVLCVPALLLVVALLFSAQMPDHVRAHRLLKLFLSFVILGNLSGLTLLTAALLTEESADLTAPQLLMSGGVLWLINVIVFGLTFWTLDCGGPVQRAMKGHGQPDFQFPQDENPQLARPGWYPRLEDYVYVAMTNGIAFSPTDAMPLTRWAKGLMGLDAIISVGAVLLVAARAVNVLGA